MWRLLRITLLLLVLAVVVSQTWLDRLHTTSWNRTLWIGIYPLNGDGSETAERYVSGLRAEDFVDIERFDAREANATGSRLQSRCTSSCILRPRSRHRSCRKAPAR